MATSTPRPKAKEGSVVSNDDDTVLNPGLNDVVCGRGGHTIDCNANVRFRSLVETYKQRYIAVSKNQKTSIAVEIVRRWRSLEPRGRFLTKTDPSLGDASPWKDIGHKKAVIKALQCLRERASPTRAQTQALFNTTSSGQQTPAAGCFPHYPLHQAHFPQAHVAASLTTQSAASSSPPTPSAPVPACFQAGSAPPAMMPNMFARNPSLSASSSRNSSLSSVSQQGLQPHQQEVATPGTVNATYTLPVSAPPMMTGAHCKPAPNVQFGQALATVLQAALTKQAPAVAPPTLVPHNTNILQVMLVQEVAKLLGGITPSPSPPPAYQPVAVTPLPRTVSPSLSPTVAALSHQPVPPMIPMAVMASLVGMMSASSSAPPAPQANTGFQCQPPAPPPTGTATPPPAAAASTSPAQSKLTPAELTTVIQLLTATSSGAGVTGQPPSGGGESVVSPTDIQRVLALGKIMTGVAARGK